MYICMRRFSPSTFLERVEWPPTAPHRSGKPSFYLHPLLSILAQALHLFLQSLRKTSLCHGDFLSHVVSIFPTTGRNLWRIVYSLQQVAPRRLPAALLLPSLPSPMQLFLSLHSLLPVCRCRSSLCHLPRPTTLLDRGGSSICYHRQPSCLALLPLRLWLWPFPSPPRLPSRRPASWSPSRPPLRNLRLRFSRARSRFPSLSPSASAPSPRLWPAPSVLLLSLPLRLLLLRRWFLLPRFSQRSRSLALSVSWPR